MVAFVSYTTSWDTIKDRDEPALQFVSRRVRCHTSEPRNLANMDELGRMQGAWS